MGDQAEYSVRCIAYAPPGATMSVPLARAVGSFVTSVVIGKDMVPRLSLPTVHSLLGDILSVAIRARVAKATILGRTLAGSCCCGVGNSVPQLLYPTIDDAPHSRLRGVCVCVHVCVYVCVCLCVWSNACAALLQGAVPASVYFHWMLVLSAGLGCRRFVSKGAQRGDDATAAL